MGIVAALLTYHHAVKCYLPLVLLAVTACDGLPAVTPVAASASVSAAPSHAASASTTGPEPPLPKLDLATASPRVRKMALPARFAAALPTTHPQWEAAPDRYPPETYVSARMCAGDPSMQRRVLASWRAAAQQKKTPPGFSVHESRCEPACRWAVRVADDGKQPRAVREAAAHTLGHCLEPRAEITRIMGSSVAPADAVESWLLWLGFDGLTAGYLPSMKRVLEHGKTAPNSTYGQRLAAVAVGQAADPKIAKLLLDYHGSLSKAELRNAVAFGMRWQTDPRAQKTFLGACRGAKRPDPLCPSPGASLDDSLDAQVRGSDFDPERFLAKAKDREPALRKALAGCIALEPVGAKPTDDFQGAWCIQKLARFDWAAARKKAQAATPAVAEHLRQSGVALKRFDSAEAMVRHLDGSGFSLRSRKPHRTPISVVEALEQGGRAHHFDTETGTFPNYHDELLTRLALLSDRELAGAVFEEIAPAEIDGRDPYELRAYLDGSRYALAAENMGDWYDVDAVLGLLNALLAERKSAWRYAAVPTGGQDIIVVAAPEQALARAARDGLLDLGVASGAVEAGKAFEDKVLEQLREKQR